MLKQTPEAKAEWDAFQRQRTASAPGGYEHNIQIVQQMIDMVNQLGKNPRQAPNYKHDLSHKIELARRLRTPLPGDKKYVKPQDKESENDADSAR